MFKARNSIHWNFIKTLVSTMPWKITFALLLMIFLSLTMGFELVLLLPILQLVGVDVMGEGTNKIVESIASFFGLIHIQPTLGVVLGLYVFIVCLHIFLHRFQTILTNSIQIKFITKLSQKLYKTILNTNWLFFTRKRSSDFTHALTNELERIDSAVHLFLSLLSNVIVALVYLLLAFQLSSILTGFVLISGLILLLVLRNKAKKASQIGEEFSRLMCNLYAAVIEHMASMKITKSYLAKDRTMNIFSKLTNNVASTYINSAYNLSKVKCWFDIGSILILSLTLYISFKVLSLSTASVLLLIYIFARIMPQFSSILQNYQLFINMLPGFNTVYDLQSQCEAHAEPKITETKNIEFKKSIRLEKIMFSYYKEEKQKLFSNLDLTIQAGKTVAIIGPSGSGKSTIADLIMGLIFPEQGQIFIDDVPLNPEFVHSWRNKIGYVTQDTFLFHDTIKANLLWACPKASDKDINEAIKQAACEEFISKLPNGIETVIGDRGVLLSGGERQRLALARALLRKPSLLILDEATNSLDPENERRIQNVIETLKRNTTILIITHGISNVCNADFIYVLEDGCLTEVRKWNSLIPENALAT